MKCKFINICPYFSSESRVCMKDGGVYYESSGYAGCYVKLEKEIKNE